mgnify:CR=1 FL=1
MLKKLSADKDVVNVLAAGTEDGDVKDEQVNFGRYFGALDAFPFAPPAKNPYLYHIRHGHNRPGNINLWHTDVTWMEKPSLGSIAQCIDIPRWGGDTCFSNMELAWETLDPKIQEKVKEKKI